MKKIALVVVLCLPAVCSFAANFAQPACFLKYYDQIVSVPVAVEQDALGGNYHDIGSFRVRTLIAIPEGKNPWLLIEVYAKSEDDDYRIITSQKLSPPFASVPIEVIEPELGRSLVYHCESFQ